MSERKACRVMEQPRSTQRYTKQIPEDEDILRAKVIELACRYGRYGYSETTKNRRLNRQWQILSRLTHSRIPFTEFVSQKYPI